MTMFLCVCVRMCDLVCIGFAVNVDLILNSNVMIKINSKPGYVEDEFLQQLVEINDLEAKAGNCQKVSLVE